MVIEFDVPARFKDYYAGLELMAEAEKLGLVRKVGRFWETEVLDPLVLHELGFFVFGWTPWLK